MVYTCLYPPWKWWSRGLVIIFYSNIMVDTSTIDITSFCRSWIMVVLMVDLQLTSLLFWLCSVVRVTCVLSYLRYKRVAGWWLGWLWVTGCGFKGCGFRKGILRDGGWVYHGNIKDIWHSYKSGYNIQINKINIWYSWLWVYIIFI
jgi:hypothetical protein